jgi:tetratricopeptide (TPR) repeat protein
MRRLSAICLLVAPIIALAACRSAKPPAVAPDARVPGRLANAERLVRAGCLDCLIAAYGEYDLLRAFPSAKNAATLGAIRTAALIALRQRELGQVDEGYRQRARTLMADLPEAPDSLALYFDVIEALPASPSSLRMPTNDQDLERGRILRANHDAWSARLRDLAATDELGAYTWLAFMCNASEARSQSLDQLLEPIGAFRDTPLITYKRAVCRSIETARIEKLFTDDPRFLETRYHLGVAAVAGQKLDDAEKRFDEAYAWRTEWPALTQSIANVAMSAEDFDRALTFYERTLQLEPHAVDAMLGKVRSLTYLGKSLDAIATTDVLLKERWFLGDAYYWRALNEAELERLDAAWADVESAGKLWVNADVAKLAGLIAYRRHELPVARTKFDEAHRLNRGDCETGYYLGVVLAELADWPRTATVLVEAGTCLQSAERAYQEEIAAIRASNDPPARQASKIARREQYIAKARRYMATSWFDVAVAYYNLSRSAEAREYAERVIDDEQFGARAKDILARLK